MDAGVVISNEFITAHILFYGATLQKLIFNGKNTVLGYGNEAEYRKNPGYYFGATVGRFANRIKDGAFTLNGKNYDVGCNEENRGHLHGGFVGMSKRIFRPVNVTPTSVTLELSLTDGEEGYPANLDTAVTYSLCGNRLDVVYTATSDGDTVYAPTNHSYFNLDGEGDILNHVMSIDADSYLPVDKKMIPLDIESVDGTPFDFRSEKAIGEDILHNNEQLERCGGFDHCFVLNEKGELTLRSHKSGIKLTVTTDMPGVQIYTGNFLKDEKGRFGKNGGVAIETQFFPDTPNRPDFPSCVLVKGREFYSKTSYNFEVL